MYELKMTFGSIEELETFVLSIRGKKIARVKNIILPRSMVLDGLKDKSDENGEALYAHGQMWHSTEDAYIQNHYKSTKVKEIARHLGRTKEAISMRISILRKLGKIGYKNKKLSKRLFKPETTLHLAAEGIHER